MARKKGKMSIVTIAEEAGVSPSLVSRVINNRTGVSEEKRRLILEKLRKHDFRVHYPIQHKPRIAIVTGSTEFSTYHAEILSGIFGSIQKYDLLSCMIVYTGAEEESLLTHLREQQCSGVILLIPSDYQKELPELSGSGLPVMLLDETSDLPGIGYVDHDSSGGSRAAVEYLLELGHRNISYVSRTIRTPNHAQRMRAYADTLASAGLSPYHPLELSNDLNRMVAEIRTHLTLYPKISAMLCVDDTAAQLTLRAAADLKIPVPEQLSVIGFDDYPLSASLCPALTTVRHPSRECGRLTVESIVRNLESNGHEAPERTILPVRLILRESAGPVPHQKIKTVL